MNYQLILLIAVIVIGGLMALSASSKRAELARRLDLTERKLAQLTQKLAANGVEGMAELWQQPLPPSTPLPPRTPSMPSQAAMNMDMEMDLDLGQVLYWLEQGKKIQAIKVYRELTGVGLKEAKDAVERMIG